MGKGLVRGCRLGQMGYVGRSDWYIFYRRDNNSAFKSGVFVCSGYCYLTGRVYNVVP